MNQQPATSLTVEQLLGTRELPQQKNKIISINNAPHSFLWKI